MANNFVQCFAKTTIPGPKWDSKLQQLRSMPGKVRSFVFFRMRSRQAIVTALHRGAALKGTALTREIDCAANHSSPLTTHNSHEMIVVVCVWHDTAG